MSKHNETLDEFLSRTCDGKGVCLREINEAGIVIRQYSVIRCVLLASGEIGDVASSFEIQIPWSAFEDGRNNMLKVMTFYEPFAKVREIEHFGVDNEACDRGGSWHIVCGEPVEDEELFQGAVFDCLESELAGVLLDNLTRKKFRSALFCRDPGKNEEESPLL